MKDAAEELIAKATADPQNTKRLTAWEVDRLRLHPDLFNTEVHTRKEDRVQLFYDLCQTAGADMFTGVTKAHCQVLVAFLDVTYPRWDANRALATERYFFPAIAEKFPQLVNKAWRGRLHYEKAAPRKRRRKRAQIGHGQAWRKSRPRHSERSSGGSCVGLFILAVLYLVHPSRTSKRGKSPAAGGGESGGGDEAEKGSLG